MKCISKIIIIIVPTRVKKTDLPITFDDEDTDTKLYGDFMSDEHKDDDDGDGDETEVNDYDEDYDSDEKSGKFS